MIISNMALQKTSDASGSFHSRVARILRKSASRKYSGFTLVELIVVISILAILATVGFLALSGYSSDAKDSAIKTNVRSVASAISNETVLTGNSPRYYVIHDPGAALTGAFVYVDGTATALTGGAWDAANTNYSAGNPDYAKLKLNADKFKVASVLSAIQETIAAYDPAGQFSIGAMDYSSAGTASGKKRASSYFQVVGTNPDTKTVTVMGTYPGGALSGSVAGLVKSPSGTGALVDGGTASGGGSSSSGGPAPTGWAAVDANCSKPDVSVTVAGGAVRTWAGCNSTLGTMNVASVNQYSGACYDYANSSVGNPALCASMTAKENYAGITTDASTAPAQTDNIYGKLYQFDTDVKAAGKCSTKTVGGQAVYGGGADCVCPTGWHVPSDAEWIELTTALNGGVVCETAADWQCAGLGWMNSNTKTSSNNVIRALGLPLAGNCTSGTCNGRGLTGIYWSSTESGGSTWRRYFPRNDNTIFRSTYVQGASFSIRCMKDY